VALRGIGISILLFLPIPLYRRYSTKVALLNSLLNSYIDITAQIGRLACLTPLPASPS
jgi:hypothetical protein